MTQSNNSVFDVVVEQLISEGPDAMRPVLTVLLNGLTGLKLHIRAFDQPKSVFSLMLWTPFDAWLYRPYHEKYPCSERFLLETSL